LWTIASRLPPNAGLSSSSAVFEKGAIAQDVPSPLVVEWLHFRRGNQLLKGLLWRLDRDRCQMI
jgi:hypothetical protein